MSEAGGVRGSGSGWASGSAGGGEGAARETGGAPGPRAPWPRREMCVSRSVPSAALRRRPPARRDGRPRPQSPSPHPPPARLQWPRPAEAGSPVPRPRHAPAPPPPGSATGSPRPFPAAATAAARAPGRPAPGAPRPAPGLRNGRRGRLDRSEHGEGPETPASPSRSPHRFLRPLGHRGASLSPATLAYSQRRAFRLPERAAGQATCCRPSAGPRAAGCRGPGVAGTSAFPLPSHSGRTPPPWGGREGRRGAGERPEAGKSSRGEGAGRPFRAPRCCVSRDYKARRVSPERDCPERGGGWRRESATHEHRPLYY